MPKHKRAPLVKVHLTDEYLGNELAKQRLTPKAERLERHFVDSRYEYLEARLTVACAMSFAIDANATENGEKVKLDRTFARFDLGEATVGDARAVCEHFVANWSRMPILEAFEAARATLSQGTVTASTLSDALDRHGRYLDRHKANPKLATQAAKWVERRGHIERALRPSLDKSVTQLVGKTLLEPMRARYHEAGACKSVYNDMCDIRNMMKLNHRTHLFPTALEQFLLSDALRAEFKMPPKASAAVSVREAEPAQFRAAYQFLMDNVRSGYACTHAAAIMTGQHQAEISKMRGDWIKEIDGKRFCHFPGSVMKGKNQLDPSVAQGNDNYVYVSARLWALILAHREAHGTTLDDGPIWFAPGKSPTLPKVPIGTGDQHAANHTRLYKRARSISGIEDWGQQVFRRTFVSVSRAGGASPYDIELSVNHALQGVTEHHYIDPGMRAADQRKASHNVVILVEAWLAKMLGETGDNVRSLDGIGRKAK